VKIDHAKADSAVLFTTDVFPKAVQEAKKYLGSKTGPMVLSLVAGKKRTFIRIEQESTGAASEIEVASDNFTVERGRKFSICVPEDWLLSFLRASGKNKIRLLVLGGEASMESGAKSSTTRLLDHPASMLDRENEDGEKQIIRVGRFGKYASLIAGLKPHFTNKPVAATYGVVEGSAFFMANDQYHGSIIYKPGAEEENIVLTTNAEAFRPMLDSDEEFICVLDQGRLQMRSKTKPLRKFWMPVFDPSASPSPEEIKNLMGTTGDKRILFDADEMREALAIMTRGGEDDSAQFSMKLAGDVINLSFASATSSADASIKCEVKKPDKTWNSELTVDPKLLYDCMTRHSGKIRMWIAENVLFMQQKQEDYLHRSFTILMD